jgi:hypothetical protein
MANPLMARKGNCTPGAAVTAACATNLGFEGSLQAEWATNPGSDRLFVSGRSVRDLVQYRMVTLRDKTFQNQ